MIFKKKNVSTAWIVRLNILFIIFGFSNPVILNKTQNRIFMLNIRLDFIAKANFPVEQIYWVILSTHFF